MDPRGARAVFWLGSYPDGACRPGKLRERRRPRIHLPPEPWLRERLTAVGGSGTDQRALYSLGGNLGGSDQRYLVRGSVLVSSAFCQHHESVSTPWSQELRVPLLVAISIIDI